MPPTSADAPVVALPGGAAAAPWVRRAAVAIHLGQPHELRRIARELASAGYPAAAGVLGNYALLLERPCVSRARVSAAVTRMLSMALAEPPLAGPPRRANGPHGQADIEART